MNNIVEFQDNIKKIFNDLNINSNLSINKDYLRHICDIAKTRIDLYGIENNDLIKSIVEAPTAIFWHHKDDSKFFIFAFEKSFFKLLLDKNDKACIIEHLGEIDEFDEEWIKEVSPIFDFELGLEELYILHRKLLHNLNSIFETLDSYSNFNTFNKNRYSKVSIVKVPDNEYFEPSYSLKKEDAIKMEEWEKEHDEKVHKNKDEYTGAIGVSKYEIKYMTTSIGICCDVYCTKCLEKAKELENKKEFKKAEKIRKQASFEIEGL